MAQFGRGLLDDDAPPAATWRHWLGTAMAAQQPNNRRRSALSRRAAVCACLALGILVAAVVFCWLAWGQDVSVQQIQDLIRSWGMWGVLGSICLMIAHSFVPFPAEFVAFANGMTYGPVWGTVITWSGAMLGALIAFALARKLGRPFVERMVASRDWHRLDDWAAKDGWRVVLVARFIPVIAFNLINYAAGLTRLTWWQFTWTTGVGILPLTVLMVVMGDNIESLGWESWLLLLAGGIVLWLAVRRRLQARIGVVLIAAVATSLLLGVAQAGEIAPEGQNVQTKDDTQLARRALAGPRNHAECGVD
jgi:uncharacterized membrane protein YdjX (TVP38/TMEM64 family)